MKILSLILALACSTLPESRDDIKSWLKKPIELQINAFVSDGCSFWPEGTKMDKDKWIKCCILHDIAYWKGGSEAKRKLADDNLRTCVKKVQGEVIATLMHKGVRVGGSPVFKTNYKWGYGWNYNRGYLKLKRKELNYVNKLSPKKGENLLHYLDKSKIDQEIKSLKPIYY